MGQRRDTVVLVGPRVSQLFEVVEGRARPVGPVVESQGEIPDRAALGLAEGEPRAMILAAGEPRVTIDGRSTLNPEAVRLTADVVIRAGGRLAGPLPSDAAAAVLFAHELARQRPDILILTQPIAADKGRTLSRAMTEGLLDPALPIVYNGPPGYTLPEIDAPGAAPPRVVGAAFTQGRADPAPTRAILTELVREHLARRLRQAGYHPETPFTTAAAAAERLTRDLGARTAGSTSVLGREATGGPAAAAGYAAAPAREATAGPAMAAAPAEVVLVVAEVDRVMCLALAGDRLQTASAGFFGTGSVDLAPRRRPPAAGRAGGEVRLPSWDSLAARLPYAVDPGDLANLTGNVLVRPEAAPRGPVEACLGGALLEELIHRLLSLWREANGKEAFDLSRPRLLAGTGFGLRRLGDPRLAAHCLTAVFNPVGVTVVGVDIDGAALVTAGGAPAGYGDSGLGGSEIRGADLVEPMAVCVSPLRATLDDRRMTTDPWAIVTVEDEHGQTAVRRLAPGSVEAVPLAPGRRARLTIEPCLAGLDFGAGAGRTWKGWVEGTPAGIILDGRGRPVRPHPEAERRVAGRRALLAAFGVYEQEEDRT